jgi:hypothetical protein
LRAQKDSNLRPSAPERETRPHAVAPDRTVSHQSSELVSPGSMAFDGVCQKSVPEVPGGVPRLLDRELAEALLAMALRGMATRAAMGFASSKRWQS